MHRAPRFRAGSTVVCCSCKRPLLAPFPEFFAVPLALPGLNCGGGRVCKSKIYGFPPQEFKAPAARSWLSVGRRGEELRERCWAQHLTGNRRRAPSAPLPPFAAATDAGRQAGPASAGHWLGGVRLRSPWLLGGVAFRPRGMALAFPLVPA